MASQEYITIDDITNGNLKQFPTDYKQKYVDRINDWFEAYALSKNLVIENIEFPVSITVLELLRAKMLMLFAIDNMGGANTNTNANGIYQIIYVTNKDQYAQLAPVVNASTILGYDGTGASTVVFGKRVR
jgi:hypothetical protein